ncbi:protoporphyrinogen oxidase HemJ [Litorilituus lipolyticus]|uniref:Protoporphyrinogen IX oxidase n=1 Tax=Litorilituus lipolyticus TaxID=2491017 RepID=A0A502L299_9GAMM|nr:protoporphyrinogen oxidase HemJ [Litorilituus lipolyticus]TPH17826.1 protoporphyrinogen oxidase HemJ [Litorilituus lipolyticus]
MSSFLLSNVLWLKAFHVIFMVAWFAGIFYLPRLFVNHAETQSKEVSEQLKGMERRLLLFVTPFALFTLILGVAIIMAYGSAWFVAATWLHIKLTLVIILFIYHGYCFKLVKIFQQDKNTRSGKFYRIFNEVPVLILFAVIILAYVKP